MRHRMAVAFALWAGAAAADIARPSSKEGREDQAVLLWSKAAAVDRVRVVGDPDGAGVSEVEVLESLKGPLAAGKKLKVPPAEIAPVGKGVRAKSPGNVALEKGKEYVLFLRGEGDAWELTEEGLFDGYGSGKPSDFGFLERGGAAVDGALEKSEAGKTLLALARLEDADAAKRVDGLRVLLRARWRSHGFLKPDPIPSIEKLEPRVRGQVVDGALAEDFLAYGFEDWAFAEIGLATSPGGMLAWAKKPPREKEFGAFGWIRHAVIATQSDADEDEARQKAVDEFLSWRRTSREDELAIPARFFGRHGAEWLDVRFRAHLEAATGRPDWTSAMTALAYFEARGGLKDADVKTLLKLVTPSEAGRLHSQTAIKAADALEKITGLSMKRPDGQREALLEGPAWAAWWEREGKDDARYK